jgi:hypothetical protein
LRCIIDVKPFGDRWRSPAAGKALSLLKAAMTGGIGWQHYLRNAERKAMAWIR